MQEQHVKIPHDTHECLDSKQRPHEGAKDPYADGHVIVQASALHDTCQVITVAMDSSAWVLTSMVTDRAWYAPSYPDGARVTIWTKTANHVIPI